MYEKKFIIIIIININNINTIIIINIIISGHRHESSVRSYSKTDYTTKHKMNETLTAMATSTAPRDSEFVSENVASTVSPTEPLSPLLPFSLSRPGGMPSRCARVLTDSGVCF